MARLIRAAALFLAASALVGATPKDAPLAMPPYVSAYEPTSVDERGLWMQADEDERVLRDSSLLVRDEGLIRYIKGVLCDEVGQDRCNSARIYVLEIPQFNASMAPNGAMRVQSGLLLRVQNEAELAAVLGHEFAHFELRHSLNGFKQRRSSSDVGAWIQVLGGISNTNTGSLQTAVLGTQYSFNRAQETDADLLSMKYMARSPYQASAAASVWDYVMAEDDARSAERGKKVQRRHAAGFFDTHPTSLARSTYLKEEAARLGTGGDLRALQYREAIRPFLPRFLAAQVKSNDFGGSEYLLQTMSQVEGWTGELLFARGELYRQRANPRDLASASDMFRQAIAKGYAQPEVHRELGLSLLRNGQQGEGRTALQQYLSLKPDATDSSVIKMLVGN